MVTFTLVKFLCQDGKPVITDANVEVKDKNQTLIIKVVKLEHNGTYHCKVWNPLGEVQAEGNVTIAGEDIALLAQIFIGAWQVENELSGECKLMIWKCSFLFYTCVLQPFVIPLNCTAS
jgi:hypothetical protein